MDDDDLYPTEDGALKPPDGTKIHRPRSPTLRDQVPLQIVSEKTMYEYECPTHTADELQQLCKRRSRLELHGAEDFRFNDNVTIEKVEEHKERYAHTVGVLQSKL